MPYGTVKVDNVTFTNNSVDATTTFSGIYASITNNLTLSGTATAATFTGTTANFTNVNAQNISITTSLSGLAITGGTAGFTTITGTTVTGTTANFVTVSGTTVTGTTASFTSGIFTSLSGTTHTITSGVFALGTAALPSISFVSDPNTGIYSPGADQVAVATNGVARLTTSTTAVSSSLAIDHPLGAVGTPSITFTGDLNTGFYSPAADTLAAVTAGSNRLHITSGGLVGIGTSAPGARFHVEQSATASATTEYFRLSSSAGNDAMSMRIAGYAYTGNARAAIDFIQNASTDFQSKIAFSTSAGADAVERVRIDEQGRVGIGTTSPGAPLEVNGTIYSKVSTSSDAAFGAVNSIASVFLLQQSDKAQIYTGAAQPIVFTNNNTERARIDSSGRLLVGTSTAYAVDGFSRHSYFCPTASDTNNNIVVSAVSGGLPALFFTNTRGATPTTYTVVQNGDTLGALAFFGADGSDYSAQGARISCEVDGTPGANDMPGRLVFSTTADGASSPTERLRITSAGVLQIADAGNITFGTTTGTKIGTATTQKLGFYNATPVVQPTAVADATTAVDVITQLNALLAKLRTLGIIAT